MRRWQYALLSVAFTCSYATTSFAQIEYHKLPNGLRVVLSKDTAAPLARIGAYYGAGSVHEPPGRAGFAHFFEHFMAEGSENVKPGEYFDLVVSNGGRFGARTLYDFTKYNTTVPKNALELMLWVEADRMRSLRFDSARFENVRNVVKNEVRQQAFDRPYGRFAWADLREAAFVRWENSHSIYGDADGKMIALDSATLSDARAFYETYYTPDNAVLVVHGDIDPAVTLQWIRRYFGEIPRARRPRPALVLEPRRTEEKRVTVVDRNAPRPALAVAYHMPPRSNTKDFWTMAVIDHLLGGGRDAWLVHHVVRERGLTEAVYTEISPRHGQIFTTGSPNLWAAYSYHDAKVSPDSIVAAMDTQIERLRAAPVDAETLQRAITKAIAQYYVEMDVGRGDGRTDLLGQFALFDDDPRLVDHFESMLRRVTPADVQRVAREYLRPTNRVVLTLKTKDMQ